MARSVARAAAVLLAAAASLTTFSVSQARSGERPAIANRAAGVDDQTLRTFVQACEGVSAGARMTLRVLSECTLARAALQTLDARLAEEDRQRRLRAEAEAEAAAIATRG